MVTCDQQEKVAYGPKVSLENFLQIRNSFWRYAELNRLWVGWSEIPFLWELQQDDRTVCCGHTIVLYLNCIAEYQSTKPDCNFTK